MKDQLRIRLGAVSLAVLTVAAIIFAILNFQQRSHFILPDDGVTWADTGHGVMALRVAADGPGAQAGIKSGDLVESLNGRPARRATDVTRVLWHAGPWAEIHYGIERSGESFHTTLVTEPQHNPSSIENYLRITALLYLFIGLFIFVRRFTSTFSA
jgi:two-component system, NtrC family, sensor kinase